jgi:hypothetical protein
MNVTIHVHPAPSAIARERERTYDALTITSAEVELVIFLDEAVREALLVALADGLPRYSIRTIGTDAQQAAYYGVDVDAANDSRIIASQLQDGNE